jgi:translation initiation factor IF-2
VRTQIAMQALDFATVFNVLIGKERLGTTPSWRVEMSAPDGPSTAGGKQALQHVKLVPDGGGAVTVAGSANTVDKTAELRTWEHLAQLHAARYKGAELPLDRVRYAALVKKMQAFFAEQGMQVTLVDAPRAPTAAAAPMSASSSATLWIAVAIMLAGAGALLYFLLRKA